MKPNGVSAVLCLGMQLRRSMMVLWPCHCNRCDWLPRNNYFDWLLYHYEGNRLIRWQHLWYPLRVSTITPGLPCRVHFFDFSLTQHDSGLTLSDMNALEVTIVVSTALLCIASGVPRQMLMFDWCLMLSALTLWSTLMLMSRDLVVHEMNGQSVVTSI